LLAARERDVRSPRSALGRDTGAANRGLDRRLKTCETAAAILDAEPEDARARPRAEHAELTEPRRPFRVLARDRGDRLAKQIPSIFGNLAEEPEREMELIRPHPAERRHGLGEPVPRVRVALGERLRNFRSEEHT